MTYIEPPTPSSLIEKLKAAKGVFECVGLPKAIPLEEAIFIVRQHESENKGAAAPYGVLSREEGGKQIHPAPATVENNIPEREENPENEQKSEECYRTGITANAPSGYSDNGSVDERLKSCGEIIAHHDAAPGHTSVVTTGVAGSNPAAPINSSEIRYLTEENLKEAIEKARDAIGNFREADVFSLLSPCALPEPISGEMRAVNEELRDEITEALISGLKAWNWETVDSIVNIMESHTRKPEPVSVGHLHKVFTEGYMEESECNAREIEHCEKAGIKAVLDAAGVRYSE